MDHGGCHSHIRLHSPPSGSRDGTPRSQRCVGPVTQSCVHVLHCMGDAELLIFGGEGFGDCILDDMYRVKVDSSASGELTLTAKSLT